MTADAARLDPQNPWPGLDAFDEDGRAYFHGRDEEIAELLRKVHEGPLTVVFGKSGLGKTSLLRAGLFPRLRERGYFPVYVRLALHPEAPPLVHQMRDRLAETLLAERIDAPPMREDESLWAYLHRSGLEFWNALNFLVTPVFVLDQFEELFTLGAGRGAAIAALRNDLGDLAENRIPEALKARLSGPDADALLLRGMPYKLLISLREDFLPEIESWRTAIPGLGKVRFRLLPMRPDQAFDAVAAATALVDAPVARRIVSFVSAAAASPIAVGDADVPDADRPAPRDGEVEPALLSLFCRGLNEARKRAGRAKIDEALLEGAKQSIIDDYYTGCFEGMPDEVSCFVENELITEKGFRNSYARDDAVPAHMTDEQLQRLVNLRLLRIGESYGAQRIELTHDLLTRVVRDHRDRRREAARAAEAARQVAAERAEMARRAREHEQALEAERQKEREDHLRAEARAGRRFRLLAIVLANVLVVALVAAGIAWKQWRDADRARLDADRQRAEAQAQRQLAQERLQRITEGLRMKQAVLSGDRSRIQAVLSAAPAAGTERIRFTARADDLGYRNPAGKRIYKFSLMPDPATAAAVKDTVAVITYRMDHPTFQNALLATGPERDFTASYTGWGCLRQVVALVEYKNPDRPPELTAYDMCEALGW